MFLSLLKRVYLISEHSPISLSQLNINISLRTLRVNFHNKLWIFCCVINKILFSFKRFSVSQFRCKFINNIPAAPFIGEINALKQILKYISPVFEAHPKSPVVNIGVISFRSFQSFLSASFSFIFIILVNKWHVFH